MTIQGGKDGFRSQVRKALTIQMNPAPMHSWTFYSLKLICIDKTKEYYICWLSCGASWLSGSVRNGTSEI